MDKHGCQCQTTFWHKFQQTTEKTMNLQTFLSWFWLWWVSKSLLLFEGICWRDYKARTISMSSNTSVSCNVCVRSSLVSFKVRNREQDENNWRHTWRHSSSESFSKIFSNMIYVKFYTCLNHWGHGVIKLKSSQN